ncbi:MAG: hypothetical protein HC767_06535 [Akkermansiaceae bacterium]|nr:hypothetical protein [Akkermansiaceae bacterium]
MQALAEFAGVLVPEATTALEASGGELGPALQQQLLRVPVREEALLDMVHEYCTLRGLPTPPKSPVSDIAAEGRGTLLTGSFDAGYPELCWWLHIR